MLLNLIFGIESIGFRRTGDFSNSEAISMGIKETLRYGLFLGTFAGTFVSVDEAICSLVGHQRHACSTLFAFVSECFHHSFKCFVCNLELQSGGPCLLV